MLRASFAERFTLFEKSCSERRRSRPGWYSTQSSADRIGEPDKGGDNLSERDGYRAGVPCWVAAVLPDPEKAVAFYTELFDWEARETMELTHPNSTSSAPFVAATSPRSARSAAGRAVRARVAHLHPGGERRLHHRQDEKSGRERGHETVGLDRRRPRADGLRSGGGRVRHVAARQAQGCWDRQRSRCMVHKPAQ